MSVSRRHFLKAGGALFASLGGPVMEEGAQAAAVSPPTVTGKVPVLGTARMHQQQNWMADWIAAEATKGRALPWTLGADLSHGILAFSKKGAAAARVQAWHVWGNPTELYSEVPWFDPQGRSHPYSAETSDDFANIVADLAARPPPEGPRGICMPVSQATIIPHPTIFPPFDASMQKSPNTGFIPRTPLVIWLRHDAYIQFGYADGRVTGVGHIPGIVHSHDACIDGRFMTVPRARKLLYVCDLGMKDGKGNWSGGRIAMVDRLPGAVAVGGTPPEDPSKYVVTTMAQAGYPTAVRSDEAGDVYFIDDDKGGEITKIPFNGVPGRLCTVSGAFALDYANGKLYVACKTGEVHIVDAATGVVGPNLMPAQYLFSPFQRGTDFMTISVDANGTCGPVGTFMCSRVHTNGNVNTWQFSPDGSVCKYGNAVYNSGQGWNTCGDAHYVHEIFGHYDWTGGKYHIDQAVQFVGGYANTPVGVLVFDPPYPAQAAVDYTAVWRGMKNICRGGPVDDKKRPSLTCLMTREGWSPFAGCSNDEIAEMTFDTAQAWIQGGYAGSFPRPDITGADLYCVMLFHLVNSQRHIREGAPFIASFQAWWKGKYGPLPVAPADTIGVFTTTVAAHPDGNAIPYRLEVRETVPGQYKIGIFGSYSNDTRYAGVDYNGNPNVGSVPGDAVIVVDEGTAQQTTWPGTLTPGWHSFTVRATGWATGAVSYYMPAGGTSFGSHVAPSISYGPGGTRATSGGAPLTYSVNVRNNDTVTTGSTFDVSAVVPRGWSAAAVRTPTVAPGGVATVPVTVTPPAGVPASFYTVMFKAANTANITKTASITALISIGPSISSSSSFTVNVASMQAFYVRPSNGTSYAPITTQVIKGRVAVPGASVVVTVRDPAGVVTTYSGVTASVSGKVYTNVPFTHANLTGAYTVSVVATLGGSSSTATTSYVLK
jgi:hypothetical protein